MGQRKEAQEGHGSENQPADPTDNPFGMGND